MFVKHLLDKTLITLEVGQKTALFILLTKEGTIHRKGNGNAESELPLRMGVSHQGFFEALMMTVNEDIFQNAGLLKMPNPQGEECSLTIIFQGAGNLDISFRVVYGHDSEGPPAELVQILINAVKLTEGWYQEQLQMEETEDRSKSWWQFWK